MTKRPTRARVIDLPLLWAAHGWAHAFRLYSAVTSLWVGGGRGREGRSDETPAQRQV